MADHEATRTVDAPASALFDYLSDVGNLPSYFSRMTSAHRAKGDAVEVTAKIPDGREVEGEAWFTVDDQAKKITWGSEGPNDYRGALEVSGEGSSSRVTVHLHSNHGEGDEVQKGLDDTVDTIKAKVEAG